MSVLLDAIDEFHDRAAIAASARYIRDEGLDPSAIEARAGALGLVRAEFLPGNRFEFRRDGEVAAIAEVLGADDEHAIDLVGWPVDRPEQFATMLGFGAVLGAARIENPATYFGGQPLRVFRNPLAWLQAAGQGVVVLDRVAAVGLLAEAPGPIAGEDVQHGRELARLLRHYVAPSRILAPVREAA